MFACCVWAMSLVHVIRTVVVGIVGQDEGVCPPLAVSQFWCFRCCMLSVVQTETPGAAPTTPQPVVQPMVEVGTRRTMARSFRNRGCFLFTLFSGSVVRLLERKISSGSCLRYEVLCSPRRSGGSLFLLCVLTEDGTAQVNTVHAAWPFSS